MLTFERKFLRTYVVKRSSLYSLLTNDLYLKVSNEMRIYPHVGYLLVFCKEYILYNICHYRDTARMGVEFRRGGNANSVNTSCYFLHR